MMPINIYQLASMTDSQLIEAVTKYKIAWENEWVKNAALTRYNAISYATPGNAHKPKKAKPNTPKIKAIKPKPWYQIF